MHYPRFQDCTCAKPYLQPYLLGDSYTMYNSLGHAELTDEQVHLTVIPALRAMVGRHTLDPETVYRAVRDNILAIRMD